MTRADKLLEGFKLGSLGAGTKKFVAEPQSRNIKILKEDDPVLAYWKNSPYILWQDTDDMKYCLALIVTNSTESTLFFYAGEKLNHTGTFCAGASIIASLKKIKPHDEVLELFNMDVRLIKKDGIFGIISSLPLMFAPLDGYKDRFSVWLKQKAQEKVW